jgi:hypothetical protein
LLCERKRWKKRKGHEWSWVWSQRSARQQPQWDSNSVTRMVFAKMTDNKWWKGCVLRGLCGR